MRVWRQDSSNSCHPRILDGTGERRMQISDISGEAGVSRRSLLADVLRLCWYEGFRMRRRAAFVVLCSLAVTVIVIPVLAFAVVANLDVFSAFRTGDVEILAGALGFSVTPFSVVAMCIGALVFGADFGSGGYRALHARGATRIEVPVSKFLFIFLALAALLIVGWAVSLLVAQVVVIIQSGAPYPCGDCGESLALLGRAGLGVVLWALIGSGLAYWGGSTTFGVGVGFGYYFVSGITRPALELGLMSIWGIDAGPALHWLPDNLVSAFFNADSQYINYWFSGLGALAYCGSVAAFILWLSRARDLKAPR